MRRIAQNLGRRLLIANRERSGSVTATSENPHCPYAILMFTPPRRKSAVVGRGVVGPGWPGGGGARPSPGPPGASKRGPVGLSR